MWLRLSPLHEGEDDDGGAGTDAEDDEGDDRVHGDRRRQSCHWSMSA